MSKSETISLDLEKMKFKEKGADKYYWGYEHIMKIYPTRGKISLTGRLPGGGIITKLIRHFRISLLQEKLEGRKISDMGEVICEATIGVRIQQIILIKGTAKVKQLLEKAIGPEDKNISTCRIQNFQINEHGIVVGIKASNLRKAVEAINQETGFKTYLASEFISRIVLKRGEASLRARGIDFFWVEKWIDNFDVYSVRGTEYNESSSSRCGLIIVRSI